MSRAPLASPYCTVWMLSAILLLAAGASSAGQLEWTQDDWSDGDYHSVLRTDPTLAPGLLVLDPKLDDIRLLSMPTAFQGIYSMVTYHDTLFMGASDYPYMYDGADVIAFDYETNTYEVCYQPYESGLHIIKQFGDSLYLPGPDSMDPWNAPGSIYLYTGTEWIEKATVPYAVHVNDVEIMNGVIYVTTGQGPFGEDADQGCVWMSTDGGDTFTKIFGIYGTPQEPFRRMFGAGQHDGRLFFQPDGFVDDAEVLYSTVNGTDWDTIPVPGLPVDFMAMFTPWEGSLLMTIDNRLFIWDGEEWAGHWLPYHGYRWCRSLGEFGGSLYGGGFDCEIYRWLDDSHWDYVAAMGVEPDSEDVESIVSYRGRMFISTSQLTQGNQAGLYVSACEQTGSMVSSVHDFGTLTHNGMLSWEGAEFPPEGTIRFRVRSGETLNDLYLSFFLGPDGTQASYYEESGTALADAHWSDRFFQYRVYLDCPEGLMMPYLDRVTLAVDSLDLADVEDRIDSKETSAQPVLRLSTPGSNPARGAVALGVELSGIQPGSGTGRPVRVRVIDTAGRLLREAQLPLASSGAVHWRWDARDREGRPVAAGCYQILADMPGTTIEPVTRRVLLVK